MYLPSALMLGCPTAYAAMDPVQPPAAFAPQHAALAQPRAEELAEGDHPVLAGCDSGDHLVGRGAFRLHTVHKAPERSASPPAEAPEPQRSALRISFPDGVRGRAEAISTRLGTL